MNLSNGDMLELARRQPIPVPWDRDVFVRNVAEQRGRPITLVPTDTAVLGDIPCGLWVAREHDDLILHEIGTTEYHIDQIVGHEIGHILLDHRSQRAFGSDMARERDLCRQALPGIDPRIVTAVLGRMDGGSSSQEQQAEMFASLLMIAAAEANDRSSALMRNAFFRHR